MVSIGSNLKYGQDNAGPNVECYMEPMASKASMASRSAVGAPVPKTPVDAGKVPVLPRDAEKEEVLKVAVGGDFATRERGTDCAEIDRNLAPDVRDNKL